MLIQPDGSTRPEPWLDNGKTRSAAGGLVRLTGLRGWPVWVVPDGTKNDPGVFKSRAFRDGGSICTIGDVYDGSLDQLLAAPQPPADPAAVAALVRYVTAAPEPPVLDWRPDKAHPEGMDRRVMIMCDTRASGITAELNDSYFVRFEPRPSGGVTVLWTDLPDQAMVFDDAAAGAEFCRDSPLRCSSSRSFPCLPPPPVESEADFLKRLHRMVVEGEAKRAPVTPAEADELRALGLM